MSLVYHPRSCHRDLLKLTLFTVKFKIVKTKRSTSCVTIGLLMMRKQPTPEYCLKGRRVVLDQYVILYSCHS